MSESRNRDNIDPNREEAPKRPASDEEQVKRTAGVIVGVIAILFALGAFISALGGGGASITAGALGVGLGILSYFLGSNRLGTIAVVFSIAALFFGLAASQGYIPGISASDRDLPDKEIRAN